jgi:hypothetical protein
VNIAIAVQVQIDDLRAVSRRAGTQIVRLPAAVEFRPR